MLLLLSLERASMISLAKQHSARNRNESSHYFSVMCLSVEERAVRVWFHRVFVDASWIERLDKRYIRKCKKKKWIRMHLRYDTCAPACICALYHRTHIVMDEINKKYRTDDCRRLDVFDVWTSSSLSIKLIWKKAFLQFRNESCLRDSWWFIFDRYTQHAFILRSLESWSWLKWKNRRKMKRKWARERKLQSRHMRPVGWYLCAFLKCREWICNATSEKSRRKQEISFSLRLKLSLRTVTIDPLFCSSIRSKSLSTTTCASR